MIDSHCHLADDTYAADLDEVIDRAKRAGLERALIILEAANHAEAAQARRAAGLWPELRVAIGVHPHHAGRHAARPSEARDIVAAQLDTTPDARAVGEIGLDYHYDFAPRDVQQQVFRAQLQLAVERDLPVIIHTREADDDTIAILGESSVSRGVLHCFTGTPALRDAGLALGFYISLAGIVTFPKAGDLRDTVAAVPLSRILTETDSPFLAPVPFRGTRNEPAHVVRVVEVLAEVFNITPAELDRHATDNFHTLFRP